jgi:thiol-disulfide isomerase/thioredoxin
MMIRSIRKLVLFIVLILLPGCYGFAQEVDVIKAQQLYEMVDTCALDFCVYNFWATWCGPCIRELPEFDKLSRENKNLKVRLISLDEVEELNGSVKLFIRKRKISSEVMLLDETDFNDIIPRISDTWFGAIPATLIVGRHGQTYFYEKEFKSGELPETIGNLPFIDN